jgi:7-keto-8-aminopelargonate synthetase-like enzyme
VDRETSGDGTGAARPAVDHMPVSPAAADDTRLGHGWHHPADSRAAGPGPDCEDEHGAENAMRTANGVPVAELGRIDSRWEDLERLRTRSPMYDAVIDEVRGRRIRIGDRWLADFASCNYLGFDVDEEIIDAVHAELVRWGTHPSWSRLLGNPRPYIEIEEQLTALLAAPDTLVLPTITLIHTSVIPILAGRGHVLVEAQAHKTVYDGCTVARGQGASLHRFRADDIEQLDELLRRIPARESRLVCMDGVNSMTGNIPDLTGIASVCRAHEALLYVDDAHGFGLIGERPDTAHPYGRRGNSVVRHAEETYDNVILVGGFSKAYSSMLAFLALPTWLKNHLKVAAPPYLYSGPSPTASLATVLAGFRVNETRGDAVRADLAAKTGRVLDHIDALGVQTPNRSGLPIIEIPLARAKDIEAVGAFLFDHGIYVTLAAYPLVPHDQVGFRIQITAANRDDELDELNQTLSLLADRFELRRRAGSALRRRTR